MVCPRCLRVNSPESQYCALCGASLAPVPPSEATLTLSPAAAAGEGFATGQLFAGRYQIIEEIGHGGMGRVYKAYDAEVQEKIALKLIRPDIAADPAVVERFRNELKLARKITHPNVCRVFDLGVDAGKVFFTMEYVEGKDLAHVIRMTGPLTMETALDYGVQICEGLAAAHRLGVIHRDLKPHNIMVSDAGGVKIMDFGIARTLTGGSALSEARSVGTPDYMSPEQVAGRPIDGRTDIYAVGLVLYEMVTGKRRAPTETSSRTSPRGTQAKTAAALNPRVPAAVDGLIVKCLAENPTERFRTADELHSALAAVREAFLSAAGPSRAGRFKPMTLLRTAAPWVLLVLLVLALFFKWPGSRAPADPPLSPDADHRLAVLQFRGVGQDAKSRLYGEALADEIRARLETTEEIHLIAKSSCDQIRDMQIGVDAIGRKLQARHILAGSYSLQNGRLDINVQLEDAADNTELGHWDHADKLDNLAVLEDLVAADVAKKLGVQLVVEKRRNLTSADAVADYIQGQNAQWEFRKTQDQKDYRLALEHYKEAIKKDPNYVLPYVGLGNLTESLYANSASAHEGEIALVQLRSYYRQAVELDPNSAQANVGLAWAYLYDKDDKGAADLMRKGLGAAPENADVNYHVGAFLRTVGLFGRAVLHFQKSAALDRLNPEPTYNAASSLWALGRLDESLEELRSIADAENKGARFQFSLFRIYILRGAWADAGRVLGEAKNALPGKNAGAADMLRRMQAWLAAARGDRETALALLQKDPQPVRYEVTNAYCLLGDKSTALDLIVQGFETGFEQIKDYLYPYEYLVSSPILKTLEAEPRYRDLLKKAKAEYDRWTKLCDGL